MLLSIAEKSAESDDDDDDDGGGDDDDDDDDDDDELIGPLPPQLFPKSSSVDTLRNKVKSF